MEVAAQVFSDAIQVAVFDMAFHQTMPAPPIAMPFRTGFMKYNG
jgi:acetate kinase